MAPTSPSARPRRFGIECFRLRDGFFGDFIDRRRRRFLFAESVAVAERVEFVLADAIHNVPVQTVQARVAFQVESAGQQKVQRVVKFFPRFSQVAGLKIQFAGIKRGLALGRDPLRAIRFPAGSRRVWSGVRHSAARSGRGSCFAQGEAIWTGLT